MAERQENTFTLRGLTTRRELLSRWLPAGLAGFFTDPATLLAMAFRSLPDGVHRADGDVRINDQPVRTGDPIDSGDTVNTGPASQAVVVLDRAVYLVREQTRMVVTLGEKNSPVRAAIRVLGGRMLSVFGGGRHQITTQTAVIGIRGSGLYVMADTQRTYACTCYGTARIQAADDADVAETVTTRHHEAPRYIYPPGRPRRIVPAPVIDHTDAELIMLEAVVGRRPPFVGTPYDDRY